MPNGWLPCAEQIARVLAKTWLRSPPSGGGGPVSPHPPGADPTADTPPPAGAPGGAPRDTA